MAAYSEAFEHGMDIALGRHAGAREHNKPFAAGNKSAQALYVRGQRRSGRRRRGVVQW